jgi:hypothetical protein
MSKFIPNVAHVDRTRSTALQPHKHQPTDQYKELLTEYSTKAVERFAALKKKAFNLAPVRHTENPQFVLQNKIFAEIITDLSKYDLDTVNPYLLILESSTHEQRVEAQRVICAIMKRGMQSFSFFLISSISQQYLFSLLSRVSLYRRHCNAWTGTLEVMTLL